ncbi:class I SAM-dependent methyltransferase [Sneathiella limimaris]|uniref:class I SAM-dependent methyltransferase n=1 Tax=Sneathiella limimaris TaxID=1964213 RepID=UPI00146CCF45|nr:class I SAM-dependent methyltransferase [Sneathiella limimaris]
MNFTEKVDHCRACLSPNIKDTVKQDEMQFSECSDCGFIFMNPMIDQASIAAYYRDYPGTASYKRKADKKFRRARSRMRRLSKKISGGRFLDIGCSAGFVVKAAQEKGFNAYGIDLSEEAIEYGKQEFPGCHFDIMAIEQAADQYEPFDLLYTSEVIEHVLDPDSFADSLSRLMKPGSLVYLTTPDAGHIFRPKDIKAWHEFKPPEHCLYFTKKALQILFARHGIQLIRKTLTNKTGLKILARKV